MMQPEHGPSLTMLRRAGATLGLLVRLGVAGLLVGCATLPAPTPPARWPEVSVVVASDPHLLGPELVSEDGWERVEAGAFQEFRRGPALIASFVQKTLEHPPQLVILAGDLTKEGERASHQTLVRLLVPLRDAGIPVLVVPGNHDVLNPGARAYQPGPVPAPSVQPQEFAQIYADFGYRDALSRDPGSLSYLAEPVPGLRVLALDTARYEDHGAAGRQVTAGRIRSASWPWIEGVLADARRAGVPVLVVMHHGLVEKFPGQAGLFGDYLIADRRNVARRLASGGVEVVVSGHFHSLSATTGEGRDLLEVEAGTLSQAPFGYRRLAFQPDRVAVTTSFLGDHEGAIVEVLAERMARRLDALGVPRAEADPIASGFARAFAALEAGDPVRPDDWVWPPPGLGLMGGLAVTLMGPLPEAFWTPYGPSDLAFTLPLPLGPVEE